jgi:hypothetical protein
VRHIVNRSRRGGDGTSLERPSCYGYSVPLGVAIAAAWLAAWLMSMSVPARSEEAEAATIPLSIAVFTSTNTRPDRCYEPGAPKAIRYFVAQENSRINAEGGLGGRTLGIEFIDDNLDPEKTVANIRHAIANKNTIAMVGMSSFARTTEVFKAAGAEIGDSGIPFLSDVAQSSAFAKQANVYTMRSSQEDERIPVMQRFIKDLQVKRPAFIGIKGNPNSDTLGKALAVIPGGPTLVADHRIALVDRKLDPGALAAAIENLKQQQVDFVFVGAGGGLGAQILASLAEEGIKVPLFFQFGINRIFQLAGVVSYPNAVYQLAWEGPPDSFNERLRQRILRSNPERLIFGGIRNPNAPGWRNGECRSGDDEPDAAPSVFDPRNLFAVSLGTQYADMVALIADALKSARADADVGELRRHVLARLKTAYAVGSGAFRGQFDNWSFRRSSRTASRTPLILQRSAGSDSVQLAPSQYVRLRSDDLRRIRTLYADIDLIRLFRVDDNEKSFFAEFYLSLFDDGVSDIEQIEFANAFLDPGSKEPQLSITQIHKGGQSDTYPESMKLYRVSGKFMFRPDFGQYPFDTQKFSIELQPKYGDAPFIIQPPPANSRDTRIDAEGWNWSDQYVGYDEDFIPITDARNDQKSIVPFYKGNFTWIMRRAATDYYLRVVIPLIFILIVAYLSIFIPKLHFEAIITIQVTALLSAVALYLAIPKVNSQAATISDKIFLFDYMAVSLMIGLSIVRVNPWAAKLPGVGIVVNILHIFVLPILVVAMVAYTLGLTLSPDQSFADVRDALRQLLRK